MSLFNRATDFLNPLFRAIEKADVDLFCKYAQKWSATKDVPSLRNSKDETLLDMVTIQMFKTGGHPNLVGIFKELLRLGANPNLKNKQGYSALSYLIGYIPHDKAKEYRHPTHMLGVRFEEFYFGEPSRARKEDSDDYIEIGEGRVRYSPYLINYLIDGIDSKHIALDWSVPLFDVGNGYVYPRLKTSEYCRNTCVCARQIQTMGRSICSEF